jgi:hypothetical protein
MLTKEKPATLIQLVGLYRHAEFPADQARRKNLAGAANTIQSNCAVTIHFADRTLRNSQEDGEVFFTLCAVRAEAMVLKRKCAGLTRQSLCKNLRKEVESLRREYDNFTDSVKHLFTLLDRGLAGRLDGVL